MKTVNIYVFPNDTGTTSEDKIRLCLSEYEKNVLKEELEKAPSFNKKYEVNKTELGKPYVDGEEIGVSVSHSDEYFVCAVGMLNMGVDIEHRKLLVRESKEEMQVRLNGIAKRFFHPTESKYVLGDPIDRFFKVWTAKESLVKHTGEGINDNFSRYCVYSPVLEKEEGIRRWRAEGKYFWQMTYCGDYELCLCSDEECAVSVINIMTKQL
ncbi:MAG: 4'-phosphopantetheinyl transferase superfamily protein [Clostridia bacterium]|nr:4'-phosphopantetheinyl transferase superfamily protein [Clostridia bacterium]